LSGYLVTGATTPLGHALVGGLLAVDGDAQILAVGRESEPESGLPTDDRIVYAQTDLRKTRRVRSLLNDQAHQLEIHTVLHGPLHRSATDTGQSVHAINVEATRNLLLQSERHPTIRRFVLRSHTDIYRTRPDQPSVFAEDHPIDFSASAPQWLRDRVEADLTVCARMGMCDLKIAVLRCSECVAPGIGSQLYDYLQSAICLRPLGFDPMLNLLTIPDLVAALVAAARSDAQGVFNIPGADTLPLSALIDRARRRDIPLPGPLLRPLYGLRAMATKTEFRYDLNLGRFHFSGVADGKRAREVLGYEPTHPLDWDDL
jgi:UDP-glucose 4-epimerase